MVQYNPENFCKRFELSVESKKESLNVVLSWFDNSISTYIPDKILWECKLALTEGFTNAIYHAHKDLSKGTPIGLNLILTDEYLVMEIWDRGVFFDLAAELKFLEENPPNPFKDEHRRGLLFMRKLTDELDYFSNSQARNCLRMFKKLDFCNCSLDEPSS